MPNETAASMIVNKEIRDRMVGRICRKEREMFLQKDLTDPKQMEEIRKIIENSLKEEARKL